MLVRLPYKKEVRRCDRTGAASLSVKTMTIGYDVESDTRR